MSGWPSGLRRCVQVAVSPGGVGSNPTSDNSNGMEYERCIIMKGNYLGLGRNKKLWKPDGK